MTAFARATRLVACAAAMLAARRAVSAPFGAFFP